jgi:diadenosine tetraphosphate (Ap4A) HIT family hydrolase
MRMSHIYQPVMIKALLRNGGRLSTKEIAKEILIYDISQIEYYENVVNNMVGRVLRNRGVVEKNKEMYELVGFEQLTDEVKIRIQEECELKINDFIQKRGLNVWEHRRKNRRPVPGSIRYEVLKRANYRCELCGISADEKALEVDHITPKNKMGEDTINNFQALCYTCNSQKRDLDDTDFREIKHSYELRDPGCVFCTIPEGRIKFENNLSIAFHDNYPVTKGHMLIIPRRHVAEYFDLYQAEINAIHELLLKAKQELLLIDPSITGFNIGINNGKVAGQTVFHCHVHLIPRRNGDVEDPTGGVRNVIPGKGRYK